MKVILTQYHEKLGDVGDVVEVKDGYANNYLLPQGFAMLATRGNINQMELVKKAVQKVEAKNIEEAGKLSESLEGLEVVFTVKTGGEGKLYGSVTNKDIAEKILTEKNIEIDRKKIDLEEHIKELGDYTVDVKLYKEVKAQLKVKVEPDEESRELIEAYRKEKVGLAAGSEEEEKLKVTEEDAGKDREKGKEKDSREDRIKEKAEEKAPDKKAAGGAGGAADIAGKESKKDKGQKSPEQKALEQQSPEQKISDKKAQPQEVPAGEESDAESLQGATQAGKVAGQDTPEKGISERESVEKEIPAEENTGSNKSVSSGE